MDRETILKHSKSIRLNHQILSDFTELLSDYCERKAHPEHLQALIQMIQMPMIGNEALKLILEEYEKEYHLIRLVNLNNNTIIDIW
jgi:hypothetical protein